MPSQIVTSPRYGDTVPAFRRRTKARQASESWWGIDRNVKALLATGRTTLGIYTKCDREETLALWAQYEPQIRRMVRGYDPERLPPVSQTMVLDLIATAILTVDRSTRTKRWYGGDDGFQSKSQWYDRGRHNVLMPEMEFFARTCERGEWRWHDGGWYGDAPRVTQAHLPREFSDVKRKGADHVGIFWQPPWFA